MNPTPPPGPGGKWRRDPKFNPNIATDTIALAEWDTVRGKRLVAIGKGKEHDWKLRYAVSRGKLGGEELNAWGEDVELTDLESKFGPALVACATELHSFYKNPEDGSIKWITASGSD